MVAQGVDRLLATADAIPFGVALSFVTGIPLVYSQGTGAAAVHDLTGAYDIGHPALLVTNHLTDWEHTRALVQGARQVGLTVNSVLSVVTSHMLPVTADLKATGLVYLPDVVQRLSEQGELSPLHAQVVETWLQQTR